MRSSPPDSANPLDLLTEGAAALSLELDPATLDRFQLYLQELKTWNARLNLTALRTDRDIVIKHFLDSLAVVPFLGEPSSLADLGTGAGFPGVVLKLMRPEMQLTLVEAREKKAAFLEYLASRLHLSGVEVSQAHLTPLLARRWGPRFEAVVSRAAFCLDWLLELAAPLLLPGGALLSLKGPHPSPGELEAASARCEPLGLGSLELHEYDLPISGEPRLLVRTRRQVPLGP
jgi:16S rRNA (guanine527-N7)-methyltransferase